MMFNERNVPGWLKGVNLLGLILVLSVNALANILPINGIGTGEVSDSFPNLFAPTGFTFSIWGVIYAGLILFVIYNFNLIGKKRYKESVERIGLLFFISCILNSAWIVLWHYLMIELTLVVMVLLLAVLLRIYVLVQEDMNRDLTELIFVKWPFSIYAGWVTVATVANVTALLVKIGWDGFGFSEEFWAVVMIFVATLIVSIVVASKRDMAFGSVFLWTVFGIYSKHVDVFEGAYPKVIIACYAAAVLTLAVMAYGFIKRQRDKKRMFF
ncbi:tryptophan-rich sensory protein [Alkalibacter saccharofermentans]|uniref:TspO/MBR family protein n=1 Tax=Alkalibacter saccharofermentans DSM 14828 TaxID=1120975 RepID=A0A1M4XWP1_9FIRM|nr:tryptophan-rich sensory protein [Alkalibacter saccharofermentans]SHE97987.1 TspO/MBR family protein [Alkalibacter saccharofermentans DSM 14828]